VSAAVRRLERQIKGDRKLDALYTRLRDELLKIDLTPISPNDWKNIIFWGNFSKIMGVINRVSGEQTSLDTQVLLAAFRFMGNSSYIFNVNNRLGLVKEVSQ
jgi:hypothetical protein